MSDQPSDQATNVNPTDAPDEENWSVQKLPYEEDVVPRGFLQLCADRRFHRDIQEKFQRDANLASPTDYWIHADAGGTPKMERQTTAPNYCYYDKGVRLMGWSAHGDKCGGFGEDVPDEVIWQALNFAVERRVREYPEATHFVYFVTAKKERDAGKTMVYSKVFGKGSS
jgi:hypothetical protein